MKGFNNKIQKSLLYNLIIFDFIFLTNYTKKASSLVTKKYHVSKKLYVARLAILELLKSIKRFLRSFQFLNKWEDKKTLFRLSRSCGKRAREASTKKPSPKITAPRLGRRRSSKSTAWAGCGVPQIFVWSCPHLKSRSPLGRKFWRHRIT